MFCYLSDIDYYKITFPLATPQKTTQKILDFITENPRITRNELAEKLDITPDGVKYHLANLTKKGKIKRVGGRKTGYWEVQSN